MDFEAREKRKYIRNALLSFVCTAVCIGIDIVRSGVMAVFI